MRREVVCDFRIPCRVSVTAVGRCEVVLGGESGEVSNEVSGNSERETLRWMKR